MSYSRFDDDLEVERPRTPAPVAQLGKQFGDGGDLEAGLPPTHEPVSITPTHAQLDTGLPPTHDPVSITPTPTLPILLFMGMLRTLVAMIGRRLTCVLVCTLVVIPIVTAFSRLVIMKVVTGHADYVTLIVSHFVYTICTGVLTNMLTAHYADFITKVMCARMATVRELFAGILPETVETGLKKTDDKKDAVKSVISLAIKIIMVVLTVFITVLDSQNVAVIIVPCVNLFNIFVIRRFTKKPEEGKKSVLPFADKENDGMCPYCRAICNERCVIKKDFLKSIWTQTLLITITWIPDIICICVFTYSDSTSAIIISYMYNSWLIRDAITYAFKVMDDKSLPIRLFEQMLAIFSYLRENQVSLRKDGFELTEVEGLVVDHECLHGTFEHEFRKGKKSILGGDNGTGKTDLIRLLLIGWQSFSVITSNGMLNLSTCSLESIRKHIWCYTADTPLPVSYEELYNECPKLANDLGITLTMAKLARRSKGQRALFLTMYAIRKHGHRQGVLVMDEVTANLDMTNRTLVLKAIDTYCTACVTIFIDNAIPKHLLDCELPSRLVPIPL
jgi:ABC-type molybdenum transport system ATPase subunit/photorepair protein PhrA